MKTIKTLVEIPAKYKWKAQDEDGMWVCFSSKPSPTECIYRGGHWESNKECLYIGQGNPNPNWKDTLQRIHEYEEIEE